MEVEPTPSRREDFKKLYNLWITIMFIRLDIKQNIYLMTSENEKMKMLMDEMSEFKKIIQNLNANDITDYMSWFVNQDDFTKVESIWVDGDNGKKWQFETFGRLLN